MIHPAISPKTMPATPNAMASDFIRNSDHSSVRRTQSTSARPRSGSRGRSSRDASVSRGEHLEVFAHDGFQADEQGPRYERVSDRDLVQMRQVAKQHEVVEIEIVARVDTEPERMRETRGLAVAIERS